MDLAAPNHSAAAAWSGDTPDGGSAGHCGRARRPQPEAAAPQVASASALLEGPGTETGEGACARRALAPRRRGPPGPRMAATGTLAGSVHASFGLSPVCACGPGPQGDCGHWLSASFGLELRLEGPFSSGQCKSPVLQWQQRPTAVATCGTHRPKAPDEPPVGCLGTFPAFTSHL
jgi:hypothetical protein